MIQEALWIGAAGDHGIGLDGRGGHKPYRFSRYDRWARVLAQSATDANKHCGLTFYLDAVGQRNSC